MGIIATLTAESRLHGALSFKRLEMLAHPEVVWLRRSENGSNSMATL